MFPLCYIYFVIYGYYHNIYIKRIIFIFFIDKYFPQKNISFSNFLFKHVHKIDSHIYRPKYINFSKIMTTITKPTVGAPHFRQYAKGVRGGTYTFIRAILDLLDNAIVTATVLSIYFSLNEDSTAIKRILIQDDVPSGFENIHESDSSSPLHIGHERVGQEHDGETSQYGRGLKDSAMFLGDRLQIYTHSISEKHGDTRVHIDFDFNAMISCTDPSQSYEPAVFESIDATAFDAIHPYGTGSTVCIENIRSDTDNAIGNPAEFEAAIIHAIAQTYTTIIAQNPDKNIFVNGKRVTIDDEISTKIINNPQCIDRAITYKTMVTIHDTNGAIAAISFTREGKNTSYGRYNLQTGELEGQSAGTADYTTAQKNFNSHKLTFTGTSTVDSPLSELLYKNHIRVIRSGRNHGDLAPLQKTHNDGYNNHQFNCITYDSKQLSPFIGITSDKHVHKRDNVLYKCLTLMHQKMMKELSSKKRKTASSSDESSVASARTSRRGRPPKQSVDAAAAAAAAAAATVTVTVDAAAVDTAAVDTAVVDATIDAAAVPVPVEVVDTTTAVMDAIEHIVATPITDALVQNPMIVPEVQILHRADRENRYVKAPDARIMLDQLSAFATNNPHISIVDDLLDIIRHIASERGRHLYLLEILRKDYRGYTDNQNVMGGAVLSEIHQQYINDDVIVNAQV